MSKFDVVIIGSGLGGLICGYILSKNGFKVAVFEKNHQIGGCLQVFKRKGVSFDTGMHYIGSMGEGEILRRYFNYLSISKDVQLKKLNEDGFDVVTFEGKPFKYAMGFENFAETMTSYFPKEGKAIKKYMDSIRKIAEISPFFNLREMPDHNFIDADYIRSSVGSFISSFTDDRVLQNVLAGTNSLYAGKPNKSPIYIHALINNFYIQSAWRIIGGSHVIADSLVKSIKGFGCEIFNDSEVFRINCSDTDATSIELKNGEIIEAKYFISNVHPQTTTEMIDSKLIRKAYRNRISELENTISNFALYLSFKPGTVPYMNFNQFYFRSRNVWDNADYTDLDWPRGYLYMHQSRRMDEKFAESAQVSAYMNFRDVEKWTDTKVGKRGTDYLDFKEEKAQRIIEEIEKNHPAVKGNINAYYSSTPLTYRDYTGTKEGSIYGILRDCNSPAQTLVSQKTKIRNLFLTGQNINTHGIIGVTIGAIITCSEFLGLNNIINEINRT
jgi:all-trans-retinol 13,14-reductase